MPCLQPRYQAWCDVLSCDAVQCGQSPHFMAAAERQALQKLLRQPRHRPGLAASAGGAWAPPLLQRLQVSVQGRASHQVIVKVAACGQQETSVKYCSWCSTAQAPTMQRAAASACATPPQPTGASSATPTPAGSRRGAEWLLVGEAPVLACPQLVQSALPGRGTLTWSP